MPCGGKLGLEANWRLLPLEEEEVVAAEAEGAAAAESWEVCSMEGSFGSGREDKTSSRATFKRPCLTGRVTMAYLSTWVKVITEQLRNNHPQ